MLGLGAEVLVEAPAQGDIDDLEPSADPEHRPTRIQCPDDCGGLEGVGSRVDVRHGRVSRVAVVQDRIHVPAAHHEQAVPLDASPEEGAGEARIGGIEDDGGAPRTLDGGRRAPSKAIELGPKPLGVRGR
jgi:hypothetical protein